MRRYLSWILSICTFVFSPYICKGILVYSTPPFDFLYFSAFLVVLAILGVFVISDIMVHYGIY